VFIEIRSPFLRYRPIIVNMDTLIIGAGGHGKVVLDILLAGRKYRPVGFLDADPALAGSTVAGLGVLGSINLLSKLRGKKIRAAIVAIGDGRSRLSCAQAALDHEFELINAIHPDAYVAPTATLGQNIVVAAGACIATEARIGDSCIINTHAVVEHECEIGEGVHVCPGALLAGRVKIEASAFIGLGAKIIQCLTIGTGAVVGAGSVVLHDVPPGETVVGVPARIISQSHNQAA
jgi:sugar O-acyltransferase (sialic acid O-acetyltransferase NeuD family)